MPGLYRWNGSSWVQVPDGTALKYWDGSNWVNPNALKYWNGSSWVTAWNKSSPQVLTVTADFTTNVRYSGSTYNYDAAGEAANNDETNPRIGRFAGSASYHYISILGFPMSTIVSAMATRPNITAARLRLNRLSGSGLGTLSGANPIRVGTWTLANFRNMPAISNPASYDDWAPMSSIDVNGWSTGNRYLDIDPQHVTDLINGRGLLLSEVTTGYNTSGSTTNLYSKFAGIIEGANLPQLEVTIDY